MRRNKVVEVNGQLQAWLRTLLVIGSILGSVITSAMHVENRITKLEDGQAAIVERMAKFEDALAHLTRRR